MRVSIRDRPDHPLVSLLVPREAIHPPGNEADSTQPVHRALHDCGIANGILADRALRYSSHSKILARQATAETNARSLRGRNGVTPCSCELLVASCEGTLSTLDVPSRLVTRNP